MAHRPTRPVILVGRVFRADDVVRRGLITKESLRSRAWQRLFRGVYADARVVVTHPLRCEAAAEFLAPPGAVIAGRSAAQVHGVDTDRPDDPVEMLVSRDARFGPMQGLRIHTGDIATADVVTVGRVRVTSAVRTCWDLAQWLDPIEAVVRIDRLLASRRLRPDDLVAYLRSQEGTRGYRRFAKVVRLADGRSASPQESRLRVRLQLARIYGLQPQFDVYERGRFLGRVDLALPELKIAVEYDGVWHVGSAQQMHRDRKRLNGLMVAGWRVLHATSDRMRDEFPGLLRELRTAIQGRVAEIRADNVGESGP